MDRETMVAMSAEGRSIKIEVVCGTRGCEGGYGIGGHECRGNRADQQSQRAGGFRLTRQINLPHPIPVLAYEFFFREFDRIVLTSGDKAPLRACENYEGPLRRRGEPSAKKGRRRWGGRGNQAQWEWVTRSLTSLNERTKKKGQPPVVAYNILQIGEKPRFKPCVDDLQRT
jgi:hypothetical protein